MLLTSHPPLWPQSSLRNGKTLDAHVGEDQGWFCTTTPDAVQRTPHGEDYCRPPDLRPSCVLPLACLARPYRTYGAVPSLRTLGWLLSDVRRRRSSFLPGALSDRPYVVVDYTWRYENNARHGPASTIHPTGCNKLTFFTPPLSHHASSPLRSSIYSAK